VRNQIAGGAWTPYLLRDKFGLQEKAWHVLYRQ